MSEEIKFYEGPYYMLSNFSAHTVGYKGYVYPTAEHAYQTSKFVDEQFRENIATAVSPFLAWQYGQSEEGRAPDFNKLAVMKEIMHAKLKQHADVRQALLETGDSDILKNHPDDYFWGTGADGSGKNVMGQIWMELREELR